MKLWRWLFQNYLQSVSSPSTLTLVGQLELAGGTGPVDLQLTLRRTGQRSLQLFGTGQLGSLPVSCEGLLSQPGGAAAELVLHFSRRFLEGQYLGGQGERACWLGAWGPMGDAPLPAGAEFGGPLRIHGQLGELTLRIDYRDLLRRLRPLDKLLQARSGEQVGSA